jgi:glycosyltransferase involved in cell wall biosynthesis
MTYNQASYIEEAMNGFIIQETTFPFVCCILDDASTDSEPEVINKYMKEHFDLDDMSIVRHEETEDYNLLFARHRLNCNCYFAVLFLKYNHYSIPENKLRKTDYISKWLNNAKYIAICEGDDYWIAKDKLQKQVDFLEQHEGYTMTCSAAKLYSQKRMRFVGLSRAYDTSQDIAPNDAITRGGGFVPTCSLIYKSSVLEDYPDYCKKCSVCDWPLQIMCLMKGHAYYFDELLCVYRVENSLSWMGRQKNLSYEKRLEGLIAEVRMLDGFRNDYPDYETILQDKIVKKIIRCVPIRILQSKKYRMFLESFELQINSFSRKDKQRLSHQSNPLIRILKKSKGHVRSLKHITWT